MEKREVRLVDSAVHKQNICCQFKQTIPDFTALVVQILFFYTFQEMLIDFLLRIKFILQLVMPMPQLI